VVEEGVVVEAFPDPFDALEWLEHNRVDLVITDFKMPSMDGAAFTRALRALPTAAEVPVLVVTAHEDRSFRVRALDAGATDFLQSPVDHFEFVARARNLLALGRQGRPDPAPAGAEPPAGPDQERLLRILDAVPAMIIAADRDGRCLYANAAFAADQGSTPAALVGASMAELLGPDRHECSRKADLSVFASGLALPGYREVVVGPAGERRILHTRKTPLRDPAGAITAVVTTSIEWPAEPVGEQEA
jgi:PAS domain S-box-containing protein